MSLFVFTNVQMLQPAQNEQETTLGDCKFPQKEKPKGHCPWPMGPTSRRRDAQQLCLIFQTTAATSSSERKQLWTDGGEEEMSQQGETTRAAVTFDVHLVWFFSPLSLCIFMFVWVCQCSPEEMITAHIDLHHLNRATGYRSTGRPSVFSPPGKRASTLL